AHAKRMRLEQSARARSAAGSPAAVERRMAREAVGVAREARIAERKATKLANEARQTAALALAQAAEAAAREVALKAEQEARDAEFAERTAREAAVAAEQQSARDARYAARKARKQKADRVISQVDSPKPSRLAVTAIRCTRSIATATRNQVRIGSLTTSMT